MLQGSFGGDIRIVKRPVNWPVDFVPGAMHCALVSLGEGPWPGIALVEPEPDWRGYHTLELSIYSEIMRTFPLTLRIHDRTHNYQYNDRFNRQLDIKQGVNRFDIPFTEIENAPQGRRLDLSAIKKIFLYGDEGELGRKFYLVSIRLR